MTSTIPLFVASGVLLLLFTRSAMAAFSSRDSKLDQTLIFFLLVCAAILALRWPYITWAHELNPDESQMLAQGMRFMSHPVPWRDVDGMTGGPLDSQILTLAMYFGAPGSWQMARLVLWALNCLTLIFLYLTLRPFGTRGETQFVLMPAILFYAFAVHEDFIHYSSETLSVCLISAALCLLAKEWFAAQPSVLRCFIVGLLSGAVPFAKLQAGPLGLFLAGLGLIYFFVRARKGTSTSKNWKAFWALAFGILAVPVLILVIVALHGAFNDFWQSYILTSITYAGGEGLKKKAANLELVLFDTPDFKSYLHCAIALLLLPIAWLARKNSLSAALSRPLKAAVAFTILTLLCLLTAGKDYYHYALLLVPALSVLFGLSFFAGKALLTSPSDSAPKNLQPLLYWKIAFSVLIAGVLFDEAFNYRNGISDFRADLFKYGPSTMSAVSQRILSARRPGDEMSVWGWMPVYHVETGIPPAAREAIGAYLITKISQQDYYRKNYLADLKKSRPAFFVDAIAGNTFQWRWANADTHESFPELNKFINDNYTLWLSVHMTNRNALVPPVRIYVLKERMAGQHLSSEDVNAPADPFYPE